MAGRKLFTNQTPHSLHVTLMVRASEEPRNSAGTREFDLAPGQSSWIEYGNNINIYLNGLKVTALKDGVNVAEQHVVLTRGSPLDNQLNMRNAVTIVFENGTFYFSTRDTQ